MRTLRLLPGRVPHLPAVEGGDGFAARPHLSDEDGFRRQSDHQRNVGWPFRRLPGLYGLRDGMPFRRGIWEIDRSHPRANRTALHAISRGNEVSPFSVQHLHASGPPARAVAAVASVPENRTPDAGAAHGPPEITSRAAAGHGGTASARARAGEGSRVDPCAG